MISQCYDVPCENGSIPTEEHINFGLMIFRNRDWKGPTVVRALPTSNIIRPGNHPTDPIERDSSGFLVSLSQNGCLFFDRHGLCFYVTGLGEGAPLKEGRSLPSSVWSRQSRKIPGWVEVSWQGGLQFEKVLVGRRYRIRFLKYFRTEKVRLLPIVLVLKTDWPGGGSPTETTPIWGVSQIFKETSKIWTRFFSTVDQRNELNCVSQ